MSLFGQVRSCVVCGSAVPAGRHYALRSSSILSLNVTIYRKIRGGQQLATTKRVRVCEDCLMKCCAGDPDLMTLAAALSARISETLVAMIDYGKGSRFNRRAIDSYSKSEAKP